MLHLPWPSSRKMSSRFSDSFSFFPLRRFFPPFPLFCNQRKGEQTKKKKGPVKVFQRRQFFPSDRLAPDSAIFATHLGHLYKLRVSVMDSKKMEVTRSNAWSLGQSGQSASAARRRHCADRPVHARNGLEILIFNCLFYHAHVRYLLLCDSATMAKCLCFTFLIEGVHGIRFRQTSEQTQMKVISITCDCDAQAPHAAVNFRRPI